jgi:hypothetical protein
MLPEYPDGSKDALNFIRPLVGYGPEMLMVYSPLFSPNWAELNGALPPTGPVRFWARWLL